MKTLIVNISATQLEIAHVVNLVHGVAAYSNNYKPLIKSYLDSIVNPSSCNHIYPEYLEHLEQLHLPHDISERVMVHIGRLSSIVKRNFTTIGTHRFEINDLNRADLQIIDTDIRCFKNEWDEFRDYVQRDIEHGDYIPPSIRRAVGY